MVVTEREVRVFDDAQVRAPASSSRRPGRLRQAPHRPCGGYHNAVENVACVGVVPFCVKQPAEVLGAVLRAVGAHRGRSSRVAAQGQKRNSRLELFLMVPTARIDVRGNQGAQLPAVAGQSAAKVRNSVFEGLG